MQTISKLICAATASICMSFAVHAQPQEPVGQTGFILVNYELVLAADGSIEKLTLGNNSISDELAKNLEKQIRSWTIKPAMVEDKGARTETHLLLKIQAKPEQDNTITFRIIDANTGPWLAPGQFPQAKYPAYSLQRGHEAMFRIEASFDANGNITGAIRPGRQLETKHSKIKAMEPFEKAAITSLKNVRVTPEKVNGVGIPGVIIFPFAFCIADSECGSLIGDQRQTPEIIEHPVPLRSRVTLDLKPKTN
jgi:hypothetical protein